MLKLAEMFGLPVWLLFIIATAVGAAGGAWGMAKLKNGEIAEIQLVHAEERHQAFMEGRARQMRSDAITRDVSADFHVSNVKIIRQTQKIIEEIPIYVQDDATCITWGLVRVLDAAAFSADPDSLDLPAGTANDACAGVGWRALAKTVVGNYGKFHETADQLSKLQIWVDEQIANQNEGLPQDPGGEDRITERSL